MSYRIWVTAAMICLFNFLFNFTIITKNSIDVGEATRGNIYCHHTIGLMQVLPTHIATPLTTVIIKKSWGTNSAGKQTSILSIALGNYYPIMRNMIFFLQVLSEMLQSNLLYIVQVQNAYKHNMMRLHTFSDISVLHACWCHICIFMH